MRAAAGLGLVLELGARSIQSELDTASVASIPCWGPRFLGVMLIGACPLIFFPLREPRGQGAQSEDQGTCVYLARREGVHDQVSLGSSWWAVH